MKIDITLNIYDLHKIVAADIARRYPGAELVGLTVLSWNQLLLRVVDGTLEEPVRHHLQADHAELPHE